MSITLPRITAGYATVEALNDALDKIEAALNSQLSTEDSVGNQMEVSLDMNSQRILNLPLASNDNEPVTYGQLKSLAVNNIYIPAPHTQDWSTITGKPTQFDPTLHGHLVTQINGLDVILGTYSTRLDVLELAPRVTVSASDPTLVESQDVNDLWIY